jgi:hypothetical protein
MRKVGFSLVCSSFFSVFICEHDFPPSQFFSIGLKNGCIAVSVLGETSTLRFNTGSDDEIIVYSNNFA